MISPFDRVPKWALDWFFVATEACDGGTSDLGFFSEVSIFIRTFGIRNTSRGCPRGPEAVGVRPGGRVRPLACGFLVHFLDQLLCFGGLFWSIKKHRKFLAHFENFYFCTKNDTTVVLLKTASVRVSSNKIIPKPYKTVVNMA